LNQIKRKIKLSQIKTTFLLVLIYFIVASASFQGYFSKWSFRVEPIFSIDRMLDGTANRPYVYRQLIPQIANAIDQVTPKTIKEKIASKFSFIIENTYASVKLETFKPQYMFRCFIVYTISSASLLISMFLLRAICIEVSKSNISGTIAPICFALCFPLILTQGGYFYDFGELLFFSASFLLALRNRFIWILPITPFAVLNKESFLFFLFTLIPLIKPLTSRYRLVLFTIASVFLAAVVNFVVKSVYANNEGAALEFHLQDNIRFYLNPLDYLFSHESGYGTILPKGFSIIILLSIFIIVSKSWQFLERPIKQHTLVALAINIPLFILFCYRDELRNLSMLFIAFTIMIAVYVKSSFLQPLSDGGKATP
jgi:hypothetical protein